MINIREIDHLVLRVIDLERMLGFYCGVLGCTVERREDAIGLVQLRAGRSLVDLVPIGGPLGRAGGAAPAKEGRNLDHFCFRVEPFDEPAIRRHLAAHDIAAAPSSIRNGAEGEGPSIYIADPQGNVVELKGPAAGAPARRPLRTLAGSCHCGAVRFEIDTDFPELTTCDCSICRRKNALMVKVHESRFRLLAGAESLTEYRFHTHIARHYFCKVCGIYPFHRKRVTPDHFGINVHCLEGFAPAGLPVRQAVGAAMP